MRLFLRTRRTTKIAKSLATEARRRGGISLLLTIKSRAAYLDVQDVTPGSASGVSPLVPQRRGRTGSCRRSRPSRRDDRRRIDETGPLATGRGACRASSSAIPKSSKRRATLDGNPSLKRSGGTSATPCTAPAQLRVDARGDAHADARHRRHHRDVQRHQWRDAATAALSTTGGVSCCCGQTMSDADCTTKRLPISRLPIGSVTTRHSTTSRSSPPNERHHLRLTPANADRPGITNLFSVLRTWPIHGRWLTDEDMRTQAPVAVISTTLWRRRFNADPSLAGPSAAAGRMARQNLTAGPDHRRRHARRFLLPRSGDTHLDTSNDVTGGGHARAPNASSPRWRWTAIGR